LNITITTKLLDFQFNYLYEWLLALFTKFTGAVRGNFYDLTKI